MRTITVENEKLEIIYSGSRIEEHLKDGPELQNAARKKYFLVQKPRRC